MSHQTSEFPNKTVLNPSSLASLLLASAIGLVVKQLTKESIEIGREMISPHFLSGSVRACVGHFVFGQEDWGWKRLLTRG